MKRNNEQRIEPRQKKNAFSSNRRIILTIVISIIIIAVALASSYWMWKWYNEMLFKSSAIATGSKDDIKLYVKVEKTVKLDETTYLDFTLENAGKTEYRFYPLNAGGSFLITNQNGDEIFYSHACIDYEVTNYSLIELHSGEKTSWDHCYFPYSAGMKRGEEYFITCYYSSSKIPIDPYIVKIWEGDIVTNTVLIRVV